MQITMQQSSARWETFYISFNFNSNFSESQHYNFFFLNLVATSHCPRACAPVSIYKKRVYIQTTVITTVCYVWFNVYYSLAIFFFFFFLSNIAGSIFLIFFLYTYETHYIYIIININTTNYHTIFIITEVLIPYRSK